MNTLKPDSMVDAAAIAIPLIPVPEAQVIDGSPATGWVALTDAIGVWEHTPGISVDVEVDEVFIVLSGRATVTFPGESLDALELKPGSVGRFAAGTATRWTVHDTLRKVYTSGGE